MNDSPEQAPPIVETPVIVTPVIVTPVIVTEPVVIETPVVIVEPVVLETPVAVAESPRKPKTLRDQYPNAGVEDFLSFFEFKSAREIMDGLPCGPQELQRELKRLERRGAREDGLNDTLERQGRKYKLVGGKRP